MCAVFFAIAENRNPFGTSRTAEETDEFLDDEKSQSNL